ncbi:HAD family acid phosphatase [Rhodanobacter sp. AS-Z3]|uniref:5'-nucleotidase, lipoprotein e(P4) family n=1 Tax=Rhodanobacter sp. AS-Z3 TaxID=3031330 RepID=UPI00247A060B|nr:HAD family acid phosphatase [Rhodanobacter sp. AS-Z3]WEN15875.1 HAD family acid phosphatase [Rhodanobacter sp. AS-Z3]
MSLRLPSTLLAFALLAGCATAPHQQPVVAIPTATPAPAAAPSVAANDNLNAVGWTQRAIEHDLIYLQTYRDAQSRLLTALHDRHWDALAKSDRTTPLNGLKPAIVLDIDETVLDNSPFEARMVQNGHEYSEAEWAAWCREEVARALPGAVEFTQFAAKHGIAVIYISNRAKELDQPTLANLRKVGLPVSSAASFLGLGTVVEGCQQKGSAKGCRRQWVARHYRVLMQFGDQLGDFVDPSANTFAGHRQAVAAYLPWIGTRWFVLPNPTYGAWESAMFGNDRSGTPAQRRQRKIESLKIN